MRTIEITIKPFGAFREFGAQITLDMHAGSTISEIKTELSRRLSANDLIAASVLATDTDILHDRSTLTTSCTLSILPPVCGG